MVWAYVSVQQTNSRLIYLQHLHENCFMQLYVKIQTTQCHCITQVNPKPSGIIARDKSLTTSPGFLLGLKVVLLKMKNNNNKNVSLFPLLPRFQTPSTFLKGCQNYEDLEPDPAFAPLSRLQDGLQRMSGSGQFHFVSVNNPVSWSPGIDFFIHITDGQRQKCSRRCSFSIYPKQRQTGSGCLGCYRHPGLSGKLLVIAWLLVCFSPPNLKGLWYLQKSHSYMCCGNTCYMRFFREMGNPALQEKSGSYKITSIILCYADGIPSYAIQKGTLLQDP